MRNFLNPIVYEMHVASVTAKWFGLAKALSFVISLPFVAITRKNRTAYRLMGRCTLQIGGRQVTFAHPDVRFIDEIIINRSYTPDSDFVIRPGETIVDAGANIGIFTLFASAYAGTGRVFAIEPAKENIRLLLDNVNTNKFCNVTIIGAALSDKSGRIPLYGANPGNNSIIGAFVRSGRRRAQTCQTITIQDLIETYAVQQIDLIKIDIEGAEFLIFRNPAWLKYVKRLVMEVHPAFGSLPRLTKILEDYGFETKTCTAYDTDAVYLFAKYNPALMLSKISHSMSESSKIG